MHHIIIEKSECLPLSKKRKMEGEGNRSKAQSQKGTQDPTKSDFHQTPLRSTKEYSVED